MNAKEFVRAVHEADLDLLLKDKVYEFLDFVKDEVENGHDRVILRAACEGRHGEDPFPYYVWVVYGVIYDGQYLGLNAKEFYIPKEEELESYYMIPETIKDRKYFTFIVEEEE